MSKLSINISGFSIYITINNRIIPELFPGKIVQSVDEGYVIWKTRDTPEIRFMCESVRSREDGVSLWTWHELFNLFSCRLSFSEYIQRYATEEALKEQEEGGGDSSSESSMSDFSEDEAQDMEL